MANRERFIITGTIGAMALSGCNIAPESTTAPVSTTTITVTQTEEAPYDLEPPVKITGEKPPVYVIFEKKLGVMPFGGDAVEVFSLIGDDLTKKERINDIASVLTRAKCESDPTRRVQDIPQNNRVIGEMIPVKDSSCVNNLKHTPQPSVISFRA